MSEEVICAGCGIPIQTDEKSQLGYTPASALERDIILCQRCFRLKHYNEVPDIALTDDDYIKMLQSIGDTEALVVKVVDIFDFNGSWVPGIQRFAGGNDILLVGNKLDVLPKSFNEEKLKNWMRYMAKQNGLKPVDVSLMSAWTGKGIEELAGKIDEFREGKDVYIVGCTNVGKSTFINKLIERFGEKELAAITTSSFPGTTLNFIDIPLDNGAVLYDTPGLINHNQMAHHVSSDDLKVITPKKEIKPKIYQLNEEQTLFFGGLARMDYKKGDRASFICYMSNDLYIHRTKTEKADELYDQQVGELLTPPSKKENAQTLERHEFKIKEENTDIVFSGLGWVTVKEVGLVVTVHVPEGVGVSLRRSIIKG